MLESLHVKNLALIRDAELELKDGFNVLSGETGAGKSLLLGSIGLALGKRADASLIRTGESQAYVELVFDIRDTALLERLKEKGVEPEEGKLIISRRISEGRSVSRINGETVTLSILQSITEELIDIHGQHDHQSLLKEENHLKVVDAFAKESLQEVMASYNEAYSTYRKKHDEIKKLGGDDEERKKRLDFLEFQITEIADAHIRPGEEKELFSELDILSHKETVRESLNGLNELFKEQVLGELSDAVKFADDAGKYLPEAADLSREIREVLSLSEDISSETGRLLDGADEDDGRLETVEERLSLLQSLKKKYGSSEEEILKNLKNLQKEYDALYDFDQRKTEIERELEEDRERLVEAAKALHEKRLEAAESFSRAMEKALEDLNFLHVNFKTEVELTHRFTPRGADEARFMISMNPGEPVRPLVSAASGGELSRIMLAIKSLSADADEIPTLIFDEIDQGISGKTAAAVAAKMQRIADRHQVICISHLPQIVASADVNFLIEKSLTEDGTVTELKALSGSDTLKEVARLLGDGEVTESNLRNAEEMKERLRRK